MIFVIIYLLFFIIFTSISVTILGNKGILSSDLMSVNGLVSLIFNFKLYLALFSALCARLTFTLMNSQLYKLPYTSSNSTNIASILSNTAIIGILITNYIFLGEILTLKQLIGMIIIFIGVSFILIN